MDDGKIFPMTVRELLKKLEGVNLESTITMEGCDCDAQAYDIDVNETTWDGSPTVYLTRSTIDK